MSRAPSRSSPASTALARAAGSVSAKQLPRDHDAVDLVGALADLAQLAVAQRALDGELAGVAVATVDLDGDVAGAHAGLRRPQLGHRRLARGAHAAVLHPAGATDQEARRLQLGRRVGE